MHRHGTECVRLIFQDTGVGSSKAKGYCDRGEDILISVQAGRDGYAQFTWRERQSNRHSARSF